MTTGHQLMGLMKFLGRDEWKDAFEDVLQEHFGPALEALEIEYDDIAELLDDQWAMTLWGCAFEDFLTRDLEPDGRNIAEVYLKRRGWKEDAQTRAYINVLRSSTMSLYEVSEIVPGQSMRARDLIRGGEPVMVREGTATKALKPWDRIAARIVTRGDGHGLAGDLLPFSAQAATMLLEGIEAALAESGRSAPLDDEALGAAAPLFTTAWLLDVIPKTLGKDQPVLCNGDGDEVVFHEIRFPLAAGFTQKAIAVRLDTFNEFRRETDRFWNWLDAAPDRKRSRVKRDAQGMIWDVTSDDGRRVLGNLELVGRFLVLSVSSAQRAARGVALMRGLLGDSLRPPLTDIRTIDQVRRDRPSRDAGGSEIPPAVAKLVHDVLDKEYRAILDKPVGMIGDISPRAAVKTAKGRAVVADWLKFLENRSASITDPNDPMATYDFGWMWRELGLEALRR